ncbi:hypothetical protein ACTJJB_24680 [Chitinophaga sp. 22536]|uniref:hypothetical protein n=1 Tax=unclassified Chitinophaga TaxID=2619133 RepID=UPI003F838365
MNWSRIKDDLKAPLAVAFTILFVLIQDKLFIWIFPPGKKYGVSFNAERERLGIATLPGTWITKDKYKEMKVWHAPDVPDSGYFRYTKTVIVKSGKIIYYGDIYLHIDKSISERLTIGYIFKDQNKWKYTYDDQSSGIPEKSITKAQSDSILKSWRLVYK